MASILNKHDLKEESDKSHFEELETQEAYSSGAGDHSRVSTDGFQMETIETMENILVEEKEEHQETERKTPIMKFLTERIKENKYSIEMRYKNKDCLS